MKSLKKIGRNVIKVLFALLIMLLLTVYCALLISVKILRSIAYAAVIVLSMCLREGLRLAFIGETAAQKRKVAAAIRRVYKVSNSLIDAL